MCARVAQIHRNTAFRWRHKVNDALNALMNRDQLEGIVCLDETFVERIEKGEEELEGSKKKRGISKQKVNLCCAIDAQGRTVIQASDVGRIKATSSIHVFQGKIKEGCDLVTDSQRSYHRLVQELKVTWHKIPSGKKKVDTYTLDKVNLLHSNLKQYLQRFRGVSYAFLQGYNIMFKVNEFYRKSSILGSSERLMAKLMTLKTVLTCKQIDRQEVSWLVL